MLERLGQCEVFFILCSVSVPWSPTGGDGLFLIQASVKLSMARIAAQTSSPFQFDPRAPDSGGGAAELNAAVLGSYLFHKNVGA